MCMRVGHSPLVLEQNKHGLVLQTTMQVGTAPPLVQRARTPTHARSRSQTASCRSLHDVGAIKVVSLERPDAQMKGLSFKQSELLGRPIIADWQTGSKPLAGKLHGPAVPNGWRVHWFCSTLTFLCRRSTALAILTAAPRKSWGNNLKEAGEENQQILVF